MALCGLHHRVVLINLTFALASSCSGALCIRNRQSALQTTVPMAPFPVFNKIQFDRVLDNLPKLRNQKHERDAVEGETKYSHGGHVVENADWENGTPTLSPLCRISFFMSSEGNAGRVSYVDWVRLPLVP
jgi:hypothetical protein